VFVSQASLWEMAIKVSIGRLQVDLPELERQLPLQGFRWLPIRNAHLLAAGELESDGVHRDPFHRLLVCQSRVEPMLLLTVDSQLGSYGSTVIVLGGRGACRRRQAGDQGWGRQARGGACCPESFRAARRSLLLSRYAGRAQPWPWKKGTARGIAFHPLYPSVPEAAERNPALGELLALFDAVRGGSARDQAQALALTLLEERLQP
jgi:PIN domain nuclease of toxin-antitoxin system